MNKVIVAVGTRPEVIKMAPVIEALEASTKFEVVVASSGQHSSLFEDAAMAFKLSPGVRITSLSGRGLAELGADVLLGMNEVLLDQKPMAVFVHGDTSTALYSAIAAFYLQIPVVHVEAGLRTGIPQLPFPEEANRRLIASLASFHLAPTEVAKSNLLSEGVDESKILVTGNTVVDAVRLIAERYEFDPSNLGNLPRGSLYPSESKRDSLYVVVTLHRRENQEGMILAYLEEIANFASENPDVSFVLPAHPSPVVRQVTQKFSKNINNLKVIDPLNYVSFLQLLSRASYAISDSGGIQEECSIFQVPVLICRDVTERPEVVTSGLGTLIGRDLGLLRAEMERLTKRARTQLSAKSLPESRVNLNGPFGDGHAAERGVAWLLGQLTDSGAS